MERMLKYANRVAVWMQEYRQVSIRDLRLPLEELRLFILQLEDPKELIKGEEGDSEREWEDGAKDEDA